MKHDAV